MVLYLSRMGFLIILLAKYTRLTCAVFRVILFKSSQPEVHADGPLLICNCQKVGYERKRIPDAVCEKVLFNKTKTTEIPLGET